MYHLYILKSIAHHISYTGVTHDLEKRLTAHNKGRVKSTKSRRPWVTIYTEQFKSLSEAKKREWFFKCTPQGGKLKRMILETAGIPAQGA